MAPRERTTAKSAPASRGRKKSGAAKKTTRIAAKAHAATVTHAHDPHHTYTDHRSESYKHYASIMKTVILFLGFVLLLAIIANIFAPSLNNRPVSHNASGGGDGSAQNFLDTSTSGYKAAKQYKYVMPEGSDSSSSAPSTKAPDAPAAKTGSSQ